MTREMKDSGIEWIGKIPIDWNIQKGKWILKRLERPVKDNDGVITCFRDGEVTLRSKRREEGFTFAIQEAGYQGIEPNDLVVHGMDGFAGAIGISDSRGKATPVLNVLDSTENKRFIMYYLRSLAYNGIFIALSTGIRVRSCNTNWNKLKELPYIVPPTDEQDMIANFLDYKCAEIDAIIERTKVTIGEYKKLKQSVITTAVTKGIRSNRPMKGSHNIWYGEMPTDWGICKLKYMFSIKKEIAGKEGYTVLSITQRGIIPKDIASNEGQLAENYSNYQLVVPGDFAMNHMDLLTGWVDISRYSGVTSPDYRVFILNDTVNNSRRYYLYLMQMCYTNKIFYGLGQGVSGMGRWRLQADKFLNFTIPVPPYEEQHEIAEYLDKKCTEIDALIAKKTDLLTELEAYKKSLIYEYVTGKKGCSETMQADAVAIIYPYFPAALSTQKPRFAQAILMSRILDKCSKSMGRVKLEKMMFTIEYIIGFNFDTEYVREAAGPLDKSIYKCEGIISRQNKWFRLNSSKYGVSYEPTKDKDKYKKYYEKYFSKYDPEINRIIDIFKDYTTDQAEIIATLFGAWNDAVIDKKKFTDEDVVDDVLNNWNDSKKRFGKDVWLRAMEQMRRNNLVPKGYGKRTVIKHQGT